MWNPSIKDTLGLLEVSFKWRCLLFRGHLIHKCIVLEYHKCLWYGGIFNLEYWRFHCIVTLMHVLTTEGAPHSLITASIVSELSKSPLNSCYGNENTKYKVCICVHYINQFLYTYTNIYMCIYIHTYISTYISEG